MLAGLARGGRRALVLQRALHAGGAALADEAGAAGQKQTEAPMVFSRAKGKESERLRYFVLKEEPGMHPGLTLLEQAVYETPLPGPGSRPRFARVPPPGICDSVLTRAAEDRGMAPKAAELAEALLLKGTPLEAHTLKALIHGLAKADELAAALPVLDAWLQQQEEELEEDAATQAPLQVMTLLMDTAARAESPQLILQVLARMARIGVLPSPQSLTTLLQCFMRLGQVQVAHSVLDWMRRNNLEPNVYSYTALLALPRNLGEGAAPQLLAQARSAYDKMRADGVAPNARFFTEFIRICGRAGDLAAAQEAWRDAKAAGVHRDLILHSAMIDTCAKCHDPQAALEAFRQMKAGGLRPDVVAYTSVLAALHGSPQAAATARRLWSDMQADGVQPNGMAIAAFLEILLLEGEVDEALETLAAAQPGSVGSRGGRGDRQPAWQRKSQRLIAAAGLAAEGEQTAGLEGEEGAVDLARLYERFLFAMAHKGQFEVVEHMARHMRARGQRQTLGTAAALLTAQALQHGHTAAKWLLQPPAATQQQQQQHGGGGGGMPGALAVTVHLPDSVVESCLLGRGSPVASLQSLVAGSSSGGAEQPRSRTSTANIVLAGLAAQGHTAEACQLYDWMKAQRAQQGGDAAAPAAVGGTPRGRAAHAASRTPRQRQPPPQACAPNWWTHQLLLFAALNAPRERQLELTLRAVKEAREFAARGGRGAPRAGAPLWDRRTRSAIAAVMRQSEQARELLGEGLEQAEEREERLAELRSVLR